MPFYISKQSLIDRYGESRVVSNADRDRDCDVDQDPVDRAIADAEAEINSYLAKCFIIPLPGITDVPDPDSNASVPFELKRLAADIAMYRLVPEHDVLTEEARVRYEDAIKWLEMLANKEIGLSIGAVPSSGGVSVTGPDRIFTRTTQEGLL